MWMCIFRYADFSLLFIHLLSCCCWIFFLFYLSLFLYRWKLATTTRSCDGAAESLRPEGLRERWIWKRPDYTSGRGLESAKKQKSMLAPAHRYFQYHCKWRGFFQVRKCRKRWEWLLICSIIAPCFDIRLQILKDYFDVNLHSASNWVESKVTHRVRRQVHSARQV